MFNIAKLLAARQNFQCHLLYKATALSPHCQHKRETNKDLDSCSCPIYIRTFDLILLERSNPECLATEENFILFLFFPKHGHLAQMCTPLIKSEQVQETSTP